MTDEQIITELNLEAASDETKKQLIATVRDGVNQRVGAILMESLSSEQHAHLETLQQAGNDQVVWDWLRDTMGTDMRDVYEATLRSYLDQMKESF